MCRLQCLLALFALSIGAAQSWDIAITTGNQLEFYTNKTKINNEGTQYTDLTALAYDAVHNMLLFVDKQNDNASIFSYHLDTKKYQSLVRKRSAESIQGLAFDPVNSLLFWTDTLTRSIFSMSLKPGSKNSAYGNLWIKMDDEIPRAISVDSCRGYVYWTNTNITKATIERARFDGTERKVIVSTDIYMPVSLAIDQRMKRLYWVDDREGIHFSVESSDLDGTPESRKKLYEGTHHIPNTLTVSKNDLYWVDWGFSSIWKLPKSANRNVEPKQYLELKNEKPFGIAAKYLIQDQTEGIPECKGLNNLSQDKAAINDSFSVPPDVGLFCVHGVKVNNKLECKCSEGYTGDRCDISVCQNFCFQGDCSVLGGHPTCRCKEGFFGERCEVNICTGFCLNNGVCSLNEDHKPVCSCLTDYEGLNCEKENIIITSTEEVQTVKEAKEEVQNKKVMATIMTNMEHVETDNVATTSVPCNCTSNATRVSMYSSEHISDGEFVSPTSCNEGWDAIRDPIIMVLGTLCGLLCLACAVLFTKILQLKKRPRIKKRIIVNKNVTPMTARPDQCEITIENCCNMNICETPCFEPRSTIRPTLLDAKPGKEEKRNLITNMEYPEDY